MFGLGLKVGAGDEELGLGLREGKGMGEHWILGILGSVDGERRFGFQSVASAASAASAPEACEKISCSMSFIACDCFKIWEKASTNIVRKILMT